MRRSVLVGLLAVLAACGGDDKKADPASRTFQYGAATAPSMTEAAAAEVGEGGTSDGAALQADATVDPATAGSSVMTLPDRMAAEAWSSTTLALQASGLGRTLAALGGPAAVTMTGFDDPGCVTLAPGLVTYAACTVTIDTIVIRVDGRISRTGPTLAWDLATRMTESDPQYSTTITVHATGALAFGVADVSGRARSDTQATFSGTGTPSMRFAYTTLADVDLDFVRDPFCVTGGTLELRRVWTERPPGMLTTGEYADQGLLFTWQGCGTVLVAHSR